MECLNIVNFPDFRELVIYEFWWIVGKRKEEGRAEEGQIGRSLLKRKKEDRTESPFSLERQGAEGSVVGRGMRVGGICHHYLKVGPIRVPFQVLKGLIIQVVVCNIHEFNKLVS